MSFEIIPEEEALGTTGSRFAEAIVSIENISEPGIYWDEKFLLLSMYNRGIKDGLALCHKATDRIGHLKDPLIAYIVGAEDSAYMIGNMTTNIEKTLEEYEINIERIRILLIELYTKGIKDVGELYRQRISNEYLISFIEDIDSISSTYEEEPEETWEKIRNRTGIGIEF